MSNPIVITIRVIVSSLSFDSVALSRVAQAAANCSSIKPSSKWYGVCLLNLVTCDAAQAILYASADAVCLSFLSALSKFSVKMVVIRFRFAPKLQDSVDNSSLMHLL